jgi:SOS-response transcriptional repressor LexA
MAPISDSVSIHHMPTMPAVMDTRRRLTPTMRSRKLQALDFIKRYFAQWGQSPSLDEIAGALGVSKQRAAELVHQLSLDLQIRRVRGKTRGITLIDRSEEISEADVLLRLAGLGWQLAPLTENGLPALPVLDHDPGRDIGVGLHADRAD